MRWIGDVHFGLPGAVSGWHGAHFAQYIRPGSLSFNEPVFRSRSLYFALDSFVRIFRNHNFVNFARPRFDTSTANAQLSTDAASFVNLDCRCAQMW